MTYFITIVRAAAWLLALILVTLSVVPVWARPETSVPHNIEHFGAFLITGIAFGLGYTNRFVASLALVVYSGVIEILQLFVHGRHARLSDFVVDGIAVCVGVVLASLGARWLAAASGKPIA